MRSMRLGSYASGSLWKQMLSFFFPILLGTFFQQLYNTVDAVIVGKSIGKEALAAVGGSSGTLINLLVGFFVGMSGGATVIIAQSYGAGDDKTASLAVHTSMALAIAGGAALGLGGILIAGTALTWMDTPPEVLPLSRIYLIVYFAGTIPNLIYNIGAGILRAVGDSRRPLYFLIAACLVNIVLDLLFVVVLKLGVFGAALATVLSQVVSAVMVWRVLRRTEGMCRLFPRQIRFHGRTLLRIVRIGIPAGVQSAMYAIANVLVQSSVNSFGTDIMAAWTAVGKLDNLYWMISGAFGTTVATFAGQNFGAGNYGRMKKVVSHGMAMDALSAGGLSLLMAFFGRFALRLFLDDPGTIQLGVEMILCMSTCYLLFVPVEVLSAACRSAGDALRPMLITAAGICGFRIAWLFTVVARWHEARLLYLCYPITWLLTSVLFLIYYRHGAWLRRCTAPTCSAQ